MRTTNGKVYVYIYEKDPFSNVHTYSPHGEINVETRDNEEIIEPCTSHHQQKINLPTAQ